MKDFAKMFLYTVVVVFSAIIVLTAWANAAHATTDGMREWLKDKPGSVYEELYVDYDIVVLARITDCDGKDVWLVGGMLSAEDQRKYSVFDYTWMYTEDALTALRLLSVYFDNGDDVVEARASVPVALCRE